MTEDLSSVFSLMWEVIKKRELMEASKIRHDSEVVFVFAVIRKEDYSKLKIPDGSMAKALEIGEATELCDMEKCKGWGGIAGIGLARLGKRMFPEIFKMLNPEGPRAPHG